MLERNNEKGRWLPLDFSQLEKALDRLDAYCRATVAAQGSENAEQLRAGAIQAFEYTYELAIKTLRRYLEANFTTAVDHLTFRDFLRVAAEHGLLDTPNDWIEFREKRNITSHTYDEALAAEVFGVIPSFAGQARALLINMKAYACT